MHKRETRLNPVVKRLHREMPGQLLIDIALNAAVNENGNLFKKSVKGIWYRIKKGDLYKHQEFQAQLESVWQDLGLDDRIFPSAPDPVARYSVGEVGDVPDRPLRQGSKRSKRYLQLLSRVVENGGVYRPGLLTSEASLTSTPARLATPEILESEKPGGAFLNDRALLAGNKPARRRIRAAPRGDERIRVAFKALQVSDEKVEEYRPGVDWLTHVSNYTHRTKAKIAPRENATFLAASDKADEERCVCRGDCLVPRPPTLKLQPAEELGPPISEEDDVGTTLQADRRTALSRLVACRAWRDWLRGDRSVPASSSEVQLLQALRPGLVGDILSSRGELQGSLSIDAARRGRVAAVVGDPDLLDSLKDSWAEIAPKGRVRSVHTALEDGSTDLPMRSLLNGLPGINSAADLLRIPAFQNAVFKITGVRHAAALE